MLKHLVFADCATLCTEDPHMQDLFVAMAYGMYPFCVQEDRSGTHLVFRRIGQAVDLRDRPRRLAEAVQALAELPSVQKYHASLSDGNEQLHVQSNPLAVAWPLSAPRDMHREVVPDLLAWTQWDIERPWENLRRQLAASAAAAGGPATHVPTSWGGACRLLDWVGRRELQRGVRHEEILAVCRRVAQKMGLGTLHVVVDPNTGQIADVQEKEN